MFDFFREMGEELAGIDSDAARKHRKEKAEQKKLDRFIYTRGMKTLTITLGILYVLIAVSAIIALRTIASGAGLQIVKYIFMSIVAIVVIFALIFGKKKGEIVAVIGTFIFVVGLFLSTALM